MKVTDMVVGNNYNFQYQKDHLIYLGNNWSGNGYWHQFAKVDEPTIVWAEALGSELHLLEETK